MLNQKNSIIRSFYFSNFINGLFALSFGAILIYIINDFNLTFQKASFLISATSFSSLLCNFFSGGIVSLFGRKKSVLIISIAFTLTAFGIIFSPSYNFLFVTMIIFGIGWGFNNNLGNVIVSDYSSGSGYTIGLLHTCYAVGGFLIPILITIFRRLNLSYKIPIFLILICSIILTILFLKTPIEEHKNPEKKESLSFSFLKNPKYFIFVFIFFFYVGTESGINNFLISYLVDEKIIVKYAGLMLSVLWGLILLGRFITSHISKHMEKKVLLLILGIGFFISMGFFVICKNPILVFISIVFLGLFMAGIYPTTVSNAENFVQGSGVESGIMFSLSGLGGSFIPLFMGKIADDYGVKSSMIVVLLSSILCFVFILMNYLSSRNKAS